MPAIIALGQRLLLEDKAPHWLPSGLAAWLGAIAGTYFFIREVIPSATPRSWFHEVMTHWGLAFLWLAFFVSVAAVMPAQLDWRSLALTLLMVGSYIAWAFGGLIWSWKKCGLLKPASDRLEGIARDVSARMGVRLRGVWQLQSNSSTAYALPYTGDVIFSEKLVNMAPDEEVASICAHELAHCREPRSVLFARLAKSLGTLPFLFTKPLLHYFEVAGVFFAGVAYWIVNLWARDFSRRREIDADREARVNEGDPGVYARALARLYEANFAPAVMPRKHSHPHLYDRLLSAGVRPDYPRPEPPNTYSIHGTFLWMLLGALIAMTIARL